MAHAQSCKKRMIRIMRLTGFMAAFMIGYESPVAHASSLVFTGQNAGLFSTANPNGVSILMNSVSKKNASESTSSSSSLSNSTAQMIENMVAGQISSHIYTQIFGASYAPSGSFDLGGGNLITYIRGAQTVDITVYSTATGTTTISLPISMVQ